MNLLEFHTISKCFGERIVLKDASASVSSGITGLLGANGSGKTTLLRVIAGLLDQDSGEVFFNREKISQKSKFWRSRIGYLPQSPALYERMTVTEYLDYMLLLSGWKQHRKRQDRIEELIHSLNLVPYKDAALGHLSGGTKQRAAIGQAFIHNPSVLLLDEPTNNLDAEERIRFHNQLVAQSQQRIVLYVGHVVNDLALVCSKILVLAEAQIRFEGEPQELVRLMKGVVKEAAFQSSDSLDVARLGLSILRVGRNAEHLTIRYDARFEDSPDGTEVVPTLEEAYQAFCNSVRLENKQ
ncbi:MAG: ATP-binding cassette domain-containing protein [Bacteroidetes bacterium]|nr:ATP-binding cassette domain-containing protein [Bacteroidota bacterium]